MKISNPSLTNANERLLFCAMALAAQRHIPSAKSQNCSIFHVHMFRESKKKAVGKLGKGIKEV